MILYHGSNQDIEEVDLSKGMRYKDFGKGFYLTPDYNTACRMAKKKTILFDGIPTVMEYELDDKIFEDESICILHFPKIATAEWAHFVDNNRDRKRYVMTQKYDVVLGPIADDGVAYSLERYHEGTMTIEELAAELQDKYLDQQVMVGSQKALSYLRKIKSEQI